MGQLSVRPFLVSTATGWDRAGLRFRNVRPAMCSLAGVPLLSLLDASGPLRLAYLHDGAEPRVTLDRGGAAYVIFGKFRCDEGYARAATRGEVWLRPMGRRARFQLHAAFGICRDTERRARSVTVTPFEPTETAAYRAAR
jgi:hypothetical protein